LSPSPKSGVDVLMIYCVNQTESFIHLANEILYC
jgi:hypothetical protein